MKRFIQLNPDLKAATWEDIKAKRDELEQSPVTTPLGEFDADQKSLMRMDSAIAAFDSLPTLLDGKLGWKRANNTIVWLTKAELESIRVAIAVRAATLHYQAGVIEAGSYKVNEINSSSLWGLD